MTVVMPSLVLRDDSPLRLMSQAGNLLGVSPRRAVWRFGFRSDWPIARALALWTTTPTWVLSFHSGTVIDTFTAPWDTELPFRFTHVLTIAL